MPVEAPIWNAVSACSRRPGTTRAWASVCLLGIRPQKRMRARSLAIAAWLLSEPYGGARDHIGLLVPLGPACFLTGQAGLPLLGVAGGPSSESMRAGVHYGLTRAGLEFSSSRDCHARCHVAGVLLGRFLPDFKAARRGRLSSLQPPRNRDKGEPRAPPLRFANPSPPSGWVEDFHLQAVEHARHTAKRPGTGPGLRRLLREPSLRRAAALIGVALRLDGPRGLIGDAHRQLGDA